MHFESLVNESFTNTFVATSKAFECMQTKCKCVADKEFVLNCLKYNINNNEDSFSLTTANNSDNNENEKNNVMTPLWR
jgi:hypothetical protein